MGILSDLVQNKLQSQRDQTARQFDTWRAIVGDTRKEEEGGFTQEARREALQNMIKLAAPSKKHAQAMSPLLETLIFGGPGSLPAGGGMGPVPLGGRAPGQAGPGVILMGAGGAPQTGGMDPRVVGAGRGPDTFGGPKPSGPSDVESTPTPTPTFATPDQPQLPDGTPMPTAAPNQPTAPTRAVFQRPTTPSLYLTPEQMRAKQAEIEQAKIDYAVNLARAQGTVKNEMDEAAYRLKLKRIAEIPPDKRTPYDYTAAGINVPSGAYTATQSAQSAANQPVNQSAYIKGKNPVTGQEELGWYDEGGKWHSAPGASLANVQKKGVEQEGREDQLAAYVEEFNQEHQGETGFRPLTLETMTAQQRVEATAPEAATLRTLKQRIKSLHPEYTLAQVRVAAAKELKEDADRKARAQNVGISLNLTRQGEIESRDDRAQAILDGIKAGKTPPDSTQLRDVWSRVMALGAKEGFDLTQAERDWLGVKAHIRTMNGPAIQRQVQAITAAQSMIPMLREAYARWKMTKLPSGFRDYNKLALAAARALPGEAGAAANELNRLANDFASEVGAIYMQGNANTDHSLTLAKSNINGAWNEQQFMDALKGMDDFAKIRMSSILNSGVVQPGPNRYYEETTPKPGEPAPGAPAGGAPKQSWQTPPRPGAALTEEIALKYIAAQKAALPGASERVIRDRAKAAAKADGWNTVEGGR